MQGMRERKAKNTGVPDAQLAATDFATEGLRLRSEMQRAVDSEK
jgi:hypothetical protein